MRSLYIDLVSQYSFSAIRSLHSHTTVVLWGHSVAYGAKRHMYFNVEHVIGAIGPRQIFHWQYYTWGVSVFVLTRWMHGRLPEWLTWQCMAWRADNSDKHGRHGERLVTCKYFLTNICFATFQRVILRQSFSDFVMCFFDLEIQNFE